MLDIVVLFMRVTNRTWPAGDIVDVFPIDKDPGVGVSINPKHAIMVIRNIPRDRSAFRRIKTLLTQENLLSDTNPDVILDKRRWKFLVANLTAGQRNSIRNQGRLDIDWADVSPICIRKQQGVIDERSIALSDLDG